MRIKKRVGIDDYRRKQPETGWCVRSVDYWINAVNLCIWWAYPILKSYDILHGYKISFYFWLNRMGVMKTPVGNKPILSDIFRKK